MNLLNYVEFQSFFRILKLYFKKEINIFRDIMKINGKDK